MPRRTRYYGIRQVIGTTTTDTIVTRKTHASTCRSILDHAEQLHERGHPVPIIYEIHDDCGRRLLDVHVYDAYSGQVEVLCPIVDAAQCDAARDWEATRPQHMPVDSIDPRVTA